RKRLGIRSSAGLDERAGICVAPDNDSAERRRHVGVVVEILHPFTIGVGHVRALPRRRQGSLGSINQGSRRKILRLCVVQFLLRNQPRLLSSGLGKAKVIGMNGAMLELCTRNLMLRSGNLILAAAEF